MNFGKKIKELRLSLGKTQQDLCQILNLPRYIISNWEQGRSEPSIADLANIAEALNVSSDYLLGLEDDFGNVVIKNPDDVNLTKDEQTVLDCFRELGPFEREAILIQVKALAKEKISKQ